MILLQLGQNFHVCPFCIFIEVLSIVCTPPLPLHFIPQFLVFGLTIFMYIFLKLSLLHPIINEIYAFTVIEFCFKFIVFGLEHGNHGEGGGGVL